MYSRNGLKALFSEREVYMDYLLNYYELLDVLDKFKWVELHLHHTYKPDKTDFDGSNYQQLNDGMRNYHINTNGWNDIGQHLTVFPDGMSITGRDFEKQPASISGQNKVGAFAVEILGNFDVEQLEGSQHKTVVNIVRYFLNHNLPIKFHNEYSDKTCPGLNINKDKLIKSALEEDISPWAKESWEWAKRMGLNDGLGAKNNVTEEQLMVFLDRFYHML